MREGVGEGKRDHLVKWSMVSQPICKGGLELVNLVKRNRALLGKWLRRFSLEVNSFWHLVTRKYDIHENG